MKILALPATFDIDFLNWDQGCDTVTDLQGDLGATYIRLLILTVSHVCSKEEAFLKCIFTTQSGVVSSSVKNKIRCCAYFIEKKLCISDPHYVCQNIIISMCHKHDFQ